MSIDWTPIISDFIKIVLPATITAIVSYKMAKNQLAIQEAKIKGESEYKARENLFNVYREKIRVSRESSEEILNTFGEKLCYAMAIEDNQEKIIHLKGLMKALKIFKFHLADSTNELEEELKENKLLTQKDKEDILFIKKIRSIDLGKISDEEIEKVCLNYSKVLMLFCSFKNRLLKKKSNELFSKYLT